MTNRVKTQLEVNQPGLSEFNGGRNRFPSPIAGDGLEVDGALLADLQAVAFLLLEVLYEVKRETILKSICRDLETSSRGRVDPLGE